VHARNRAGLQVVEHVPTHGEALFRKIAAHDHEGIVAKRADAPYVRARQSTWLKIKNKGVLAARSGGVAGPRRSLPLIAGLTEMNSGAAWSS